VLSCREDGRPPIPDTIMPRFKKLAAAARLPEIEGHDVRHSYAPPQDAMPRSTGRRRAGTAREAG